MGKMGGCFVEFPIIFSTYIEKIFIYIYNREVYKPTPIFPFFPFLASPSVDISLNKADNLVLNSMPIPCLNLRYLCVTPPLRSVEFSIAKF